MNGRESRQTTVGKETEIGGCMNNSSMAESPVVLVQRGVDTLLWEG